MYGIRSAVCGEQNWKDREQFDKENASLISRLRTYDFQFANETISQPIARSVYDTEIERLRANVRAKTAEFSFVRVRESFPSRDDVVGAKVHSGILEARRKTTGQKLRDSKSLYALLLRRNFRETIINELASAATYFLCESQRGLWLMFMCFRLCEFCLAGIRKRGIADNGKQ